MCIQVPNVFAVLVSSPRDPPFRVSQQSYQAVRDVEEDVDGVQTVADVLPERRHHNHWLGAGPGQVIVMVTFKKKRKRFLVRCEKV